MKDKKRNVLLYLILIIIVFALIYFNRSIVSSIKYNYNITTGRIIRYHSISESNTPYLTYEYTVNDTPFTRTKTPNGRRYQICEDKFRLCEDKRFWVIYSPENPKKSLINLQMEIQGMKDPQFPETLEDFE